MTKSHKQTLGSGYAVVASSVTTAVHNLRFKRDQEIKWISSVCAARVHHIQEGKITTQRKQGEESIPLQKKKNGIENSKYL